jgi:putative sigma-54 modulation protein
MIKLYQADVYLKLENTSDKENKIFEARLKVPGDSFVVKKQCKSFEEGVDAGSFFIRKTIKKEKRKNKSTFVLKFIKKCFD